MLKSSKPGLTQKSKPAVAGKKAAAKPAQHLAKSAPARVANKAEIKSSGRAGQSKPAAAGGRIAARAASDSVPASRAQGTGNGEDRQEMIAIAAYYRAERRGFDGGDPMLDWLEAEAEIDSMVYH
jgi:hypothetical protein